MDDYDYFEIEVVCIKCKKLYNAIFDLNDDYDDCICDECWEDENKTCDS